MWSTFVRTSQPPACLVNQRIKTTKELNGILNHPLALRLVGYIKQKIFTIWRSRGKKEVLLPAGSGCNIPTLPGKKLRRSFANAGGSSCDQNGFLVHIFTKAAIQAEERVSLDINAQLMMVVGRTALAYQAYIRIVVKSTPLTSGEQFTFLAALNVLGESKKTDVANYAMMELSTGSDIINRLIKEGYIAERVDLVDKRSKLIQITDAGRAVLEQCFESIVKIRDLMFAGLTEDDKKLCIHLLYPIQAKHAVLAVESKQHHIDEIVALLSGG